MEDQTVNWDVCHSACYDSQKVIARQHTSYIVSPEGLKFGNSWPIQAVMTILQGLCLASLVYVCGGHQSSFSEIDIKPLSIFYPSCCENNHTVKRQVPNSATR